MLTTKHSKTVVGAIVRNKPVSISKKIYFMNPEEMHKVKKPERKRRKRCAESDDDDDDGFTVGRPQPKYFKEITAKPGFHCEPIYRGEERFAIFIAGAQGCGKSYWIKEFLKEYRIIHPKRPIYLFTGLTEIDKHFAKLIERKIMRRVVMDQETIESINLDDFRVDYETDKRRGCLIIFDDTDRIRDKVLMKKVYDLLNDALCNGRDHTTQKGEADIDLVITNHEINDYTRTKSMINNCNYIVLFPQCSPATQLNICIDKIGMSKAARDYVLSYDASRSVIIHKTHPMYCITNDKIFLLRGLDKSK